MDSSTETERIAAAWLARRDSEAWTEDDQAEFEAWLDASIAHRVAWLRIEAAWRQSDRLKALGAGVPSGQIPLRGEWTLSPFLNPTHSDPSGDTIEPETPEMLRRRRFRFAAVAASLALIAVLAAGWWQFEHRIVTRASYVTAVGDLRPVQLPDGSQATLSSGSRIEMAVSRRERRIDLQRGEVYFDVSKDPGHPFIVQAGERRVVVVGTHFSVRNDADELRVVVTEGRVQLEPNESRPPALLTAGMVAVADRDGVHIETHPPDEVDQLLSWRDGFLSFRDTPLAEAVVEFNRYSARKLVIEDPSVAAIPIGGNFRWSNADAFVRLLEQGFGVRVERRGDEIVLSGQ